MYEKTGKANNTIREKNNSIVQTKGQMFFEHIKAGVF